MALVILKNPFIHHYAGSVFDLEENNSRIEMDEHIYDRISPQRNYLLPDSGKGNAVDLPFCDVVSFPLSLNVGLDATSGPCRITSVSTYIREDAHLDNCTISMEHISLMDSEIPFKQIISIQLPENSPKARWVVISSRKQDNILRSTAVNSHTITIDFMEFDFGFYAIQVDCKRGVSHRITLIKCFPIVVTPNLSTGYFTTIKTIW